jgi:tetratricopeptide (TPR) repeat protein
MLCEKKYQEALAQLQTVKDDRRAWNALGVALYMTGQKDKAADYFRRAANAGNTMAKKNLEGIK